ncbi:KilA-N domain-containing protein [Acinetobacter sp.]|uniref:KilA-N domain-containing protein n=1 Tax=Acinetobacter sp. TaxID=472 RepID=UPI002489642C|nr:KilA-N domain-containing protein [Acinetobacter sp.]MDI1223005.1 KilA-N domain-containing protein [Acinetobacter sp.]
MTSLTQTQFSANAQPLIIGNLSIRQDEDGRYCLNDLHKASGDDKKHFPAYFLRNQQTKDLITLIESENYDMQICTSKNQAVNAIKGKGKDQGTYVVKELVYSYAMWISAKFHLMVIRAYDAMVMQTKINTRQVITPEQKDTLQKIVDHKANGNNGLRPQIWIRHNRHFKINSYHELLAIHFEDAVKYLLEMDVKQKVEKQEVKTLPYPQQVIHVAQQISQEFNSSRYDSWHVSARDGVLTAMPLPHGFYPTMDIGEFTKRFDSVLDILYGTDTLSVGRHFLRERRVK